MPGLEIRPISFKMNYIKKNMFHVQENIALESEIPMHLHQLHQKTVRCDDFKRRTYLPNQNKSEAK